MRSGHEEQPLPLSASPNFTAVFFLLRFQMTIRNRKFYYALYLTLQLLRPISSLSSHSPPDPFSFPKYSVHLYGWNDAINNLTATSILNDILSEANDDRLVDSNSFSPTKETSVRHTLMRTASGQAFLCALPPIPSLPATSNLQSSDSTSADSPGSVVEDLERKKEREKIEREGLKNGLNLISSLKDRCIYTKLGWFTYSFCYGRGEIRQFHAQIVPGYNYPQEDPNQDVYILGFHLDHPQNPHHQARLEGTLPTPTLSSGEGELTSLGRNRFSSSGGSMLGSIADVLREEPVTRSSAVIEEEEFQQKRYLVQRWDGGTICDMTGKPRTVEVQFHCSTLGSDHIALLRETTICEYLLVIHTPRLCSEPLFLDGGSRKGIGAGDTVIGCQPVLTDEEIEKLRTNEKAQRKKNEDDQNAQKLKSLEETSSDENAKTQSKVASTPSASPSSEETPMDETGSSSPWEKASSVSKNEDESVPSSPPDQTILGGAEKTHDETTPKTGFQSPEKPDEKPSQPKDKTRILEVEPITVYFDTDSGKVYVDNPAVGKRSSGSGAESGTASNGNNDQAPNLEQQSEGTTRSPFEQTTSGGPVTEFEEIAKALKESLKVLLKDLRTDDEGNNEPNRKLNSNNNRNQARPKSLAEILASLKEIDSSASGPTSGKSRPAPNGNKKNAEQLKTNWEELKKISTESHSKLVEMYQQKFDMSDDSNSNQESVIPTDGKHPDSDGKKDKI